MAYSKPLLLLLMPLLLCFSIIITTTQAKQLLHLPLTHSLSKAPLDTLLNGHQLLKSTSTASATRHRRHKHHRQVSLPLSPGSDYTLTFTLNSQTLSVYMDTGSDVVWFPCSPFQCILCEDKYPYSYPYSRSEPDTDTVSNTGSSTTAAASDSVSVLPLNVSRSSLLTCKSSACSAAHSAVPTSDLCAMAKCPLEDIEISDCSQFPCPSFYFAYGDGSLIAQLHSETLIMPSSSNNKPLILNNFTFGCSHSALGEPLGVAGFGRGALSLPAQLAMLSPELGAEFSYCLVSHSFDSTKLRHPSPLFLGKSKERDSKDDDNDFVVSKFVYTPMLENPKHPYFYSVGLEAISVGKRRIPAPDKLVRIDEEGNGGVVVDSGTTYTMLPTELYDSVATELERQVGKVLKRSTYTESKTGMRPCFYLNHPTSTSTSTSIGTETSTSSSTSTRKRNLGTVVPGLVFHFGRNSSLVLPKRNFFHEFVDESKEKKTKKATKVGCFMIMDGGNDTGPGATLGNYQQQGFHVVYDLSKGRVGFARRECATLWNELDRH